MKKIKQLAMLLVCGIAISTISSCDELDDDRFYNPFAGMNFGGQQRDVVNVETKVNEQQGTVTAEGDLDSTNKVTVFVDSLKTGTYNFDKGGYVHLVWNGFNYYSYSPGAWGTVALNKIDTKNKWVELMFTGTVVSVGNNNDSIKITDGVINSYYTVTR